MQLDASGRPDESLEVEFIRPIQSSDEDDLKSGQLLFISLQKGQLGASVNIQQSLSASLEVASRVQILGHVFISLLTYLMPKDTDKYCWNILVDTKFSTR